MVKNNVFTSLRSKTFKKFYLYVFLQIQKGKHPAQIAKKLKTSKQRLNYFIRKLKQGGFIAKKGRKTWQILKDFNAFSLGTRNHKNNDVFPSLRSKTFNSNFKQESFTNLHALQIKFPILSGKIKDQDWQIKEKLNNWLPKYKHFDTLGGLTVKNNNNKSLTVWADPRDITDKTLNEVDNLAFKIRAYVYDYFRFKHEVHLDIFNCEVKNLDLATSDKAAEEMQKKGEKFKLNFDKKAEKIFPNDNMESAAWIDGSPFNFSAETNDKDWKRAYLKMPFVTRDTQQAVNYIAQNYAGHVKMVEKGSIVFEKLLKVLEDLKKNEDKNS